MQEFKRKISSQKHQQDLWTVLQDTEKSWIETLKQLDQDSAGGERSMVTCNETEAGQHRDNEWKTAISVEESTMKVVSTSVRQEENSATSVTSSIISLSVASKKRIEEEAKADQIVKNTAIEAHQTEWNTAIKLINNKQKIN